MQEITRRTLTDRELNDAGDVLDWFEDIVRFIDGDGEQSRRLHADGATAFHPDTRFGDYIELRDPRRVFDRTQAARLDALMEEAFTLVRDPYELAQEAVRRAAEPRRR